MSNNINNSIEKLKHNYLELINQDFKKWEEVRKLKGVTGVYIVYFNNEIIYIGETNNFNVRFGVNLGHKTTHTLHKKLLRKFENSKKVKDFLQNKCRYKIKKCSDKLEAEALESLAIWLIKPKYNRNVYDKNRKP